MDVGGPGLCAAVPALDGADEVEERPGSPAPGAWAALPSSIIVPAKASTSVFLPASTSCSIEVFPSAASFVSVSYQAATSASRSPVPSDFDRRHGLAHRRLHDFLCLRHRLEHSVGGSKDRGRLVDPDVDHELVPEAADHVRRGRRRERPCARKTARCGTHGRSRLPRRSKASPKWIFPVPENRVAFPSRTASIPRIIARGTSRHRTPRRGASSLEIPLRRERIECPGADVTSHVLDRFAEAGSVFTATMHEVRLAPCSPGTPLGNPGERR